MGMFLIFAQYFMLIQMLVAGRSLRLSPGECPGQCDALYNGRPNFLRLGAPFRLRFAERCTCVSPVARCYGRRSTPC